MGTVRLKVLSLLEDLAGGSFRGHRWVWRRVLVVIKHLLETVEVKTIADVLFVNFAEELVVF